MFRNRLTGEEAFIADVSDKATCIEIRIAATFTAALARLAATEQKAAKTTAFDLQMDPAAPGLKFHRIERIRDPHFWSVRASGDLRIIVHKTDAGFLLAYVGHRDRFLLLGRAPPHRGAPDNRRKPDR